MTKRGEGSSAHRKPIALSVALSLHVLVMLFMSRSPEPLEKARHFQLHHDREITVDLQANDSSVDDLTPSPDNRTQSESTENVALSNRSASSGNGARSSGAASKMPVASEHPQPPPGNGANGAPGSVGDFEHYDAIEKPTPRLGPGPIGLSLDEAIAVAPKAAPAPTTTPKSTPVTGEDTARALEASIRSNDAQVGLGNPEEGLVAAAVQTAGRATPVPSGTRARFAVDIDKAGMVTGVSLLSASNGGDSTWGDAMSQIRGSLSKKPVELGPNARRKGVRVIVEATVMHVFASGTDKVAVVGACPTMPLVGGETTLGRNGPSVDAPAFGAMGGSAFGDLPSGTCVLGDAQTSKKQIVVRTKTQAIFPGEKQAPPPFASIPAVPRARPINLWRLILDRTL